MTYYSPIKIGYTAEPEEGWTDKIGKYIAGEVDNLILQSCVKVGCHVDKDELEKALRYDRDQYVKGYEDGKRDAAAAIEALQKDLATLQKCYEIADTTVDEVLKQLPKRGKWKPFDLTYGRSIYFCSVCEQATEVPVCMEKPMYAYCPNCGAKMEVQDA